jgi:hypothetical protein
MYYECHITIAPNAFKESHIQLVIEKLGWKFSKIDGDPVLGTGTRYYATKNYPKEAHKKCVMHELKSTSEQLEFGFGFDVRRAKIEVVVFDTKKLKEMI